MLATTSPAWSTLRFDARGRGWSDGQTVVNDDPAASTETTPSTTAEAPAGIATSGRPVTCTTTVPLPGTRPGGDVPNRMRVSARRTGPTEV